MRDRTSQPGGALWARGERSVPPPAVCGVRAVRDREKRLAGSATTVAVGLASAGDAVVAVLVRDLGVGVVVLGKEDGIATAIATVTGAGPALAAALRPQTPWRAHAGGPRRRSASASAVKKPCL